MINTRRLSTRRLTVPRAPRPSDSTITWADPNALERCLSAPPTDCPRLPRLPQTDAPDALQDTETQAAETQAAETHAADATAIEIAAMRRERAAREQDWQEDRQALALVTICVLIVIAIFAAMWGLFPLPAAGVTP